MEARVAYALEAPSQLRQMLREERKFARGKAEEIHRLCAANRGAARSRVEERDFAELLAGAESGEDGLAAHDLRATAEDHVHAIAEVPFVEDDLPRLEVLAR